ncbi:MAG: hypothetical protein R3E53_13410 [Myxococcota bacterium]
MRHVEQALAADAAGGALARPLVQGVTEVVFRDRPSGEAIAQRRFEVNVEDKAHVPGTSVLFSAAGRRFWDEFFVPLARWRNDHTIRPPIALGRPVVDVDGAGDRAIALYEDGDFDLLGLEDPMEPVTLAHYSRGEDHEKWAVCASSVRASHSTARRDSSSCASRPRARSPSGLRRGQIRARSRARAARRRDRDRRREGHAVARSRDGRDAARDAPRVVHGVDARGRDWSSSTRRRSISRPSTCWPRARDRQLQSSVAPSARTTCVCSTGRRS